MSQPPSATGTDRWPRFAVYADIEDMTWERLLSCWTVADQHAVFESAWTFDHLHVFPEQLQPADSSGSAPAPSLLRRGGRRVRALLQDNNDARRVASTGPCLDGWIALAALLQSTTRIRGGCLVTAMAYRHPAVLAKMVASTDILSGGRLDLGLGTGWSTMESNAYGIQFGSWRERFDRLDEGVECLVGLLTQPTTTFRGDYFSLVEAPCEPKPVQAPHPPILIGGIGERRTLPMVARWAQIWHAGFDPAVVAQRRRVLDERCAEIGRDPAEIRTSVTVDWDGRGSSAFARCLDGLGDVGVDLVMIRPRANDWRIVESAASIVRRVAE